MIKIVYDQDINEKLISQLVKNQKIADIIKEKIIEYLSISGVMDASKARQQVEVITGIDSIVVTVGVKDNENPLIETMSESEFYNTTDMDDYLFNIVKPKTSNKSLKGEISSVINQVMSENIMRTDFTV